MRKQISTRQRFEVFKRDNFTCQYCGSNPPNVILHIDHIIPVSKGGKNEIENYLTSCDKCNLGKSNILLSAIPKSVEDKRIELIEREKQVKGYYRLMENKRIRIESEIFSVARLIYGDNSNNGIPKNSYYSIKVFIDKIGYFETIDAMEIALSKNIRNDKYIFIYFCGICWNKIKSKNL